MQIVRAGIKELAGLVPLFDAYRTFYGQASDEEGAAAFLRERIQKEESVIFMVYRENEAAGFIQLYPTFTSIGMQRVYVLNDLFVHVSRRQEGAGRALMETAFQFCQSKGAKFVTLQTAKENNTAKALYERMGMKKDEEYDCYTKSFF